MYINKLIKKPLALVIGLATLSAASVLAQETSTAVRGQVTDEQGSPLINAVVVIRNDATGFVRTLETDANGNFRMRNLPIGSNYSVVVSRDGYLSERTEGVALNLGQTTDINFDLGSGVNSSMEEVVIVATQSVADNLASGPSSVFGLETLQAAPAINRNIADVVRIDPRIYVDEARGSINAIQCGGKSSRFNSLTVDGIRMNDSFGLNSNGYPTERQPFSYDAIEQVAVELAPFDVEYGGFTACNINAITKSGTNEIHGSFFYDVTGDDFRGDSLEGESVNSGEYDEKRFGFNVGGALIEDRLFWFAAYEKHEGANLFDRGVAGSGSVQEISVSQAELDEIRQISINQYQYDPGTIPDSFENEDEKLLVKLDWVINDQHRASFTYTHNDGNNFVEADDANDEIEFSNHLYERGSELNSYSAIVYSDWTSELSTEFRVGYLDLDGRQETVGGTDFGEIRVELDDVDVYLGGDDSRQSNNLDYDVTSFAFKAKYDLGEHNLTFGVERESLEVFNLFVQHSETEIRFDGIDNFRGGFADAIYYNNAPSQNPDDAAADWGYAINTAYLQDEFFVNDRLSIVAGLRYDMYTTGDKPEENAGFVADYGFSNNETVDGEGLFQPRFAFTYHLSDETILRGGLGKYSGGNPNVWLSNTYSANNVLQFGQRGRSFGYTDGSLSLFDLSVSYEGLEDGVPSGPGWGVPSELYDAVAAGNGDNFEINYLDPNFELPSEWKFSLGVSHTLPGNYLLNADLLLTRGEDSAMVKRGDLEQTGTTAEGYPIYDSVREASFVLTNSEETSKSLTASINLSKRYDNGIDFTVGYSYNDAEDVQPMGSSVAFSNYTSRAFFDPQEDELSISNYNIEHRFTFTFNWNHEFVGGYNTRLSLYGSANSGRPYSIAFNGTSDPYGFTPYLDFQDNVLRPGAERNEKTGSSWSKIDLRVEQELPGFSPDHRSMAFVVVDNFTNFLNDEWGVLREVDYPRTVGEGDDPESRVGDASRYEIRLGLKYDF